MRPSAVAASSRAAAAISRVSLDDSQQRDFGGVDVFGPAAIGQGDCRRHDDPRLGIVEMPSQEHRGIFVREPGQRMQRRRAHVDVFVLDHPLDRRDPSARDW